MSYKLLKDHKTNEIKFVIKLNEENMIIPFDSDNTDYQEYLEWVAEGNTPEPADEV